MTGDLFHLRKFISDSYFAGVIVTGASLTLLVLFSFFDKKYEKYLLWERKNAQIESERKTELFTSNIRESLILKKRKILHSEIKQNHSSDEDLIPPQIEIPDYESLEITDIDEAQPIRLSMFKDLKYPLIWMSIYLFAITSLIETIWYSMITKLLIKKFKYSLIQSNKLIFVQTILGIFLIPVMALYS